MMAAEAMADDQLKPIVLEARLQAAFDKHFGVADDGDAPLIQDRIIRRECVLCGREYRSKLLAFIQTLALQETKDQPADLEAVRDALSSAKLTLEAMFCAAKQRGLFSEGSDPRDFKDYLYRLFTHYQATLRGLNAQEKKILTALVESSGEPAAKAADVDYITYFLKVKWPEIKDTLGDADDSLGDDKDEPPLQQAPLPQALGRASRTLIAGSVVATAALLCVVFPPVGLAALLGSGVSLLAVQVAIPSVVALIMGVFSWKAAYFMGRHRTTFYYLAAMLLAAGLGALLAPAMPAVLVGAMTAVMWKVFAAVSFALAVPGVALLNDMLFRPFLGISLDTFWPRALLSSLLLMPMLVVLMPGALLAFGVSVAPHLLGAGVASAHVGMVFLQGLAASTGILFGMIAAVQSLGSLLVMRGVVLMDRFRIANPDFDTQPKKQQPRSVRLYGMIGAGLVALAPVVIISVVGTAFAAAGQLMLHAGSVASKALWQRALSLMPAPEFVYGAMAACLTPTVPVMVVAAKIEKGRLALTKHLSAWYDGMTTQWNDYWSRRNDDYAPLDHGLDGGDGVPLVPAESWSAWRHRHCPSLFSAPMTKEDVDDDLSDDDECGDAPQAAR